MFQVEEVTLESGRSWLQIAHSPAQGCTLAHAFERLWG